MPSYKLIYFNAMGRAEPSRYLFELAGVGYEDRRVESDEWKKLKPELLFGQLPVLEVDGKHLYQSFAIHCYLAEMLGFMPTDPWDKSQVMVVAEALKDINSRSEQWYYEQDEAKKATLLVKLTNEVVPWILGKVEKILKTNKNGEGWFVGEKLSLADVLVFNTVFEGVPTILGKRPGEYPLDNYPLLKVHSERFHALPEIKKWIEARPVTQF